MRWRVGDCRIHSCGAAIFKPHSLIFALTVALAGCAVSDRAPDRTPPVQIPPVQISEITWWQVDSDINAASLAATGLAKNDARESMERWRSHIHQRTEADFIPWFTGYWTQQWLAIKMAWYKLSAGEGTDLTVERLATYLQEQYHDRVLNPVAKEIDPDVVRGQATKRYVQFLSEQLQGIPRRYGVPLDQFDRRLKDIPAIALASPPAHSASLYQIVHANPIAKLPAYVALIAQIRKDASGAGAGPTDSRISPVAKRASEKLAAKLATSGGASAAAAAFGGVAGALISLAAAGFGAIAHENDRPEMEAQLRENLNAAVDDMWFSLMEDRATGVMAGVYYISEQIEGSLATTLTQPVELEPVPREVPLSGEEPLQDDKSDDEAPAEHGYAED